MQGNCLKEAPGIINSLHSGLTKLEERALESRESSEEDEICAGSLRLGQWTRKWLEIREGCIQNLSDYNIAKKKISLSLSP